MHSADERAENNRAFRFVRMRYEKIAGGFLDLQVPAGMVRMPVRVQDMADMPAQPLRLCEVLVRIGCVDGGGLAGNGLVYEISVIIVQAGKLVYFDPDAHFLPQTRSQSLQQ